MMARLGKPDEIANAFLYLASDASSYATGTTLSECTFLDWAQACNRDDADQFELFAEVDGGYSKWS